MVNIMKKIPKLQAVGPAQLRQNQGLLVASFEQMVSPDPFEAARCGGFSR